MSKELKLDKKIDENLKLLKVDGEPSSLEISTQDLRVKNILEAIKIFSSELSSNEISTFKINAGDVIIEFDESKIHFYHGSASNTKIVTLAFDDRRFRFYATDNMLSYFSIDFDDGDGGTTLSTADDAASAAYMTLDADGYIALDSHSGEFKAKKAGTEFSSANSAYAGMILAYSVLGESTTHTTYTLTTSYAVPDSDMNISFVAPPSGNIEIMVQIHVNSSTSGRIAYFGLSDNATYNSLGNTYEQINYQPDETDDQLCQHYWTITGLTAGTSYQYWFGAKTSGTIKYLNWGGTGANRYGDFIMKATALPATLQGE